MNMVIAQNLKSRINIRRKIFNIFTVCSDHTLWNSNVIIQFVQHCFLTMLIKNDSNFFNMLQMNSWSLGTSIITLKILECVQNNNAIGSLRAEKLPLN